MSKVCLAIARPDGGHLFHLSLAWQSGSRFATQKENNVFLRETDGCTGWE
jgi:hypothetical protein